MNKTERLNDMIIYLNKKDFFNLNDLITRYKISKSTALRDIQSLESLGMPIYTNYGRNGGYGLLKNRLISPIIFNLDEINALYFSMLTLNNYQSTPFNLELLKLEEKFKSCLSSNQIEYLEKMSGTFTFSHNKQTNPSPLLKDILNLAIDNIPANIVYLNKSNTKSYLVQFLRVSSSHGQWYVTGYNYHDKDLKVFRCDKIISLSQNDDVNPIDEKTLITIEQNRFNNSNKFLAKISKIGVDIFLKENYPSMQLIYKNNEPYIEGYYMKSEETFIADYLMSYGNEIISLQPQSLKNLVVASLKNKLEYFEKL